MRFCWFVVLLYLRLKVNRNFLSFNEELTVGVQKMAALIPKLCFTIDREAELRHYFLFSVCFGEIERRQVSQRKTSHFRSNVST